MTRFLLSVFLLGAYSLADDVPAWIREVSPPNSSTYEARIPAVVLFDETHSIVQDNGRTVTTKRKAIKILSVDGRNEAHGSQIYISGASRVKDVRGWVIEPSRSVLKLGPDNTFDRPYPGDLYNEVRVRGIDARFKVEPGAVFAYETTVEDNSVFSQFDWHVQERWPALLCRYILTVPKGW